MTADWAKRALPYGCSPRSRAASWPGPQREPRGVRHHVEAACDIEWGKIRRNGISHSTPKHNKTARSEVVRSKSGAPLFY